MQVSVEERGECQVDRGQKQVSGQLRDFSMIISGFCVLDSLAECFLLEMPTCRYFERFSKLKRCFVLLEVGLPFALQ